MDRGYVKFWRKSLDSRVFQNEGLWKIWSWCLMKASHKKRWVTLKVGRGEIEVEVLPGQFIFGRNIAAKELKIKPSTIRNRIEKLKNIGNLDIKPDNHYSVISIINWKAYQPEENKKDNQKDKQRTTKGQPKDTDKNVKKVNNIKTNPLYGYLVDKIKEKNLNGTSSKIIEFYKYRMDMPKKNKYNSNKGVDGLFRDLQDCATEKYNLEICLDITMENNWLTPRVDYFKNMNMTQSKTKQTMFKV